MESGLSNSFLYSAVRLTAKFSNGVSSDDKERVGTGFFVAHAGRVHLVTNRHVVDLQFADERYVGLGMRLVEVRCDLRSADPATGRPDLRMSVTLVNPTFSTPSSEADDVACVKLGPGSAVDPGDAKITYHLGSSFLATQAEFDGDKFVIGDMVGFPGFPEWYDAESFRPILRTGSLASDPRYPYLHAQVRGDCLAYEAFSYSGSSGSPVFAFQRGIRAGAGLVNRAFREVRVIGINAGHLRVSADDDAPLYRSHSGISYLFRSTVILARLERA